MTTGPASLPARPPPAPGGLKATRGRRSGRVTRLCHPVRGRRGANGNFVSTLAQSGDDLCVKEVERLPC